MKKLLLVILLAIIPPFATAETGSVFPSRVAFLESAQELTDFCASNACLNTFETTYDYDYYDRTPAFNMGCIFGQCFGLTGAVKTKIYVANYVGMPVAPGVEVSDMMYKTAQSIYDVIDICYSYNTICLSVTNKYFSFGVTYITYVGGDPKPVVPKPGDDDGGDI